MTRLNVANNYSTTLAASIGSADTTITVDDSTGCPSTPFMATINSLEIVKVTAVDAATNEWTVVRGQEGTSAQSHNAGVAVENRFTAGTKESIDTDIDVVEASLNSHAAEGKADDVHGLAFRGALVYLSANQSIADDTLTAINWDSEEYDTDGFHESATNPSRLTIPAGVSKVIVKAQIAWLENSTGKRLIYQTKNGTTFAGRGNSFIPASPSYNTCHQVISTMVDVAEGDYFEVLVQQDSGGALDVRNGKAYSWFAIEVVE